jgi:hypothetical protein
MRSARVVCRVVVPAACSDRALNNALNKIDDAKNYFKSGQSESWIWLDIFISDFYLV